MIMDSDGKIRKQIYEALDDDGISVWHTYNLCGVKKWHIPRRIISQDMIMFVRRGSGYYNIEGEIFPLEHGRFIYAPRDIAHFSSQSEDNPAVLWAVRYDVESGKFPSVPFCIDCKNYNYYEKIFNDIHILCCSGAQDSHDLVNKLIRQLYISLYADYMADNIGHANNKNCLVSETVKYINDCISGREEIYPEIIADRLEMTLRKFLDQFKVQMGIPFRQYIYDRKMDEAAVMISETDMKIKEISEFLMYSDQYVFSNLFKSKFGMSPSEYKKNL